MYEGPGAVAGPGAAALHAHVLQVVAGGELAAGEGLGPLQVELLQDPQTRSLHPLAQRSAGACSTAVSGQGLSHTSVTYEGVCGVLRVLAGQLHAHRHVDAAEEELELGAAANQR